MTSRYEHKQLSNSILISQIILRSQQKLNAFDGLQMHTLIY